MHCCRPGWHWQMLNSTFHYARRSTDGSWHSELVADTKQPGWKSSLALRNDRPVISYITLRDGQLYIAELDDDRWKARLVADEVSSHQLAVTRAGRLVMALEQKPGRGSGDGALVLLVEQAEGRFAQYRADMDRPVGKYLSLALSPGDRVTGIMEDCGFPVQLEALSAKPAPAVTSKLVSRNVRLDKSFDIIIPPFKCVEYEIYVTLTDN